MRIGSPVPKTSKTSLMTRESAALPRVSRCDSMVVCISGGADPPASVRAARASTGHSGRVPGGSPGVVGGIDAASPSPPLFPPPQAESSSAKQQMRAN